MTCEERFWSKIIKSDYGCWLWTGSLNGKGYGLFQRGHAMVGAHRYAFESVTGKPIPDGMLVLHICNNPRCCNPRHLYIGTCGDNMRDTMCNPNWDRFKSSCPRFSSEEEQEIRRLLSQEGWSQTKVAKKYGVTQQAISNLVRGLTKHRRKQDSPVPIRSGPTYNLKPSEGPMNSVKVRNCEDRYNFYQRD